MGQSFVYLTGSYSHRFTCKANGYKIHFYKGRAYLVKDEESIKELRADPFYTEVGAQGPVNPSEPMSKEDLNRVYNKRQLMNLAKVRDLVFEKKPSKEELIESIYAHDHEVA